MPLLKSKTKKVKKADAPATSQRLRNTKNRKEAKRVMKGMTRTELLEEVFKEGMYSGHWEALPEEVRVRLRKKWTKQLAGYPDAYIQELADPHPGTPTVQIDEAMNLLITRQTKGGQKRGKHDPLLRYIEKLNQVGKVLHGFDDKQTPIITDMSSYDRHQVVLGASGMGKSTYMANLFPQLAWANGPMILIDPHKELIEDIIPNLPKHRLKDVVYIDPTDTKRTWGVNLLQMARAFVRDDDPEYSTTIQYVLEDMVNSIVQALAILQEDTSGYGAGPMVQNIMRQIFLAAAEREDTSFVDAFNLLTVKDIQELVGPTITKPHVRNFIVNNLSNMKDDKTDAVRNKIEPFMSPILVNTFSRREQCKSITELIDENKILVFDLNTDKMPPSQSSLIGYLILTMVMFSIDRRKKKEGGYAPLYMMIDEFRNFASKTTVRWLAEARKKNAGLIVGFQQLEQLHEDIQMGLYNAGTWAVFRTAPTDADQLCRSFGLVNKMGSPQTEEFTRIPNFEAKLIFDEEDATSLNPTKQRSLVSIRGLPPRPKRMDADIIFDRLIKMGKKDYAHPNQQSDLQTVYTSTDVGSQNFLQAVFEATLAAKRGNDYMILLPDSKYKDKDQDKLDFALRNHLVTQGLVHSILVAKGTSITSQRVGQQIRNLAMRELVRQRKTDGGFAATELTKEGLIEIRKMVIPDESQNEGSEEHKQGVYSLYAALCALTPLQLEVPDQKTLEYTPDLKILSPGDNAPKNYYHLLSDKPEIHLQFEHATQTRIDKLLANVARGIDAGADPILVVDAKALDKEAVEKLRALNDRIEKHMDPNGTHPLSPQLRALKDSDSFDYRLWLVTRDGQLFEYDPAAKGVVRLVDKYDINILRAVPKSGARIKRQVPDKNQTRLVPPVQQPRSAATVQTSTAAKPQPQPDAATQPPAEAAAKPNTGVSDDAKKHAVEVIAEYSLSYSGGFIPRQEILDTIRQADACKGLTDDQIDAISHEFLRLKVVDGPTGPAYKLS